MSIYQQSKSVPSQKRNVAIIACSLLWKAKNNIKGTVESIDAAMKILLEIALPDGHRQEEKIQLVV
jgi:hypothetical protein